MAITPNAIIAYEVSDLQEISIYDASTFTGSSSINDITGIRYLFSTVNSIANAEQNVSELSPFYEYEVESGSTTINGITYSAGDKIVLISSVTPTGTFVINATGRYSTIGRNLPITGLSNDFSPSETGREAVDTLYFQDEVFSLIYEQYTTSYAVGDTLAAGTYICVGSGRQNVVINGTKTIYVGEVYVSAGSETFTGTATLSLYNDEVQVIFSTLYESFNVYQAYINEKCTSTSPSEILDSNLLAVGSLYATLDVACETTVGIDTTGLQVSIDRILNYYAVQL